MHGLMQDRPLLISSLIEHAATFHPDQEVVSRSVEGPLHRTTWRQVRSRAKQVANALTSLGLEQGDRVGTLAWNTWRHLELYYGVSGSGSVLHTVNPRLFPEQIRYIINHAEDRVLFFDISFADLVEQLAPELPTVKAFIAMTDRSHMPDIQVPNLLCYEDLVSGQSDDYAWPELDERTASSLCYTSGTTGNPKGVLYSHRSTVLHSLIECAPDCFNVSAASSILLVVPMFHANAWGMPYAAALAGARLVLPGPRMDGENLFGLMQSEGVTFSQAVPTVWLMLFQYLDQNPQLSLKDTPLKTVGIGGSAPALSMFHRFEKDGIEVVQAWGMTETSPIGVVNRPLPRHESLDQPGKDALKVRQGRGVWGVDIKITDDDGNSLPWDGKAIGHLCVRGPWIASGYFRKEDNELDNDGFFPTGDIALIDPEGYVQLVDRSKDVIKSGGEWISSMDLENAAIAHPQIAEAAVIGIPHPTWQERPLLIAVAKGEIKPGRQEILDFLEEKVAKWWLPEDVVFVEELPHTATGKLLKTKLREEFGDYRAGK